MVYDLLRDDETIKSELYCQQLQRLSIAAAMKRQRDTALPLTAQMSQRQIQAFGWEKLIHPPYSPGIAPSDFIFPATWTHYLRGKYPPF